MHTYIYTYVHRKKTRIAACLESWATRSSRSEWWPPPQSYCRIRSWWRIEWFGTDGPLYVCMYVRRSHLAMCMCVYVCMYVLTNLRMSLWTLMQLLLMGDVSFSAICGVDVGWSTWPRLAREGMTTILPATLMWAFSQSFMYPTLSCIVCMNAYVYLCMTVSVYVNIYIFKHIWILAYVHICIHLCM